jgi:hypothetical protein
MFSESPQAADIVRSAFHHLATHWYCGSLRSKSEPFQAELWSKNATRLSRIDWLWSAKRASVWVTGGSPLPGQLGEPTHAHLHHRQ